MRNNKYFMRISFGAMYGRNLGGSSCSLSVSGLPVASHIPPMLGCYLPWRISIFVCIFPVQSKQGQSLLANPCLSKSVPTIANAESSSEGDASSLPDRQ
jgi:hypothetical protein